MDYKWIINTVINAVISIIVDKKVSIETYKSASALPKFEKSFIIANWIK